MTQVRRYLLLIGAILSIAIALRVTVEIPTGITLLVLLIGWPVLGTLVTIDDDFPGGWSNPDGSHVPEWKELWWWADLFLVRGAIVVGAFATESSVPGEAPLRLWVACAVMLLIGLPIIVRELRKEPPVST